MEIMLFQLHLTIRLKSGILKQERKLLLLVAIVLLYVLCSHLIAQLSLQGNKVEECIFTIQERYSVIGFFNRNINHLSVEDHITQNQKNKNFIFKFYVLLPTVLYIDVRRIPVT